MFVDTGNIVMLYSWSLITGTDACVILWTTDELVLGDTGSIVMLYSRSLRGWTDASYCGAISKSCLAILVV